MIVINYLNFKKESNGSQPLLLFFTNEDEACRPLAMMLAELEPRFLGKLTFGKVNVKVFARLAMQNDVQAPALLLFYKGVKLDIIPGNLPKKMLLARLESDADQAYATQVQKW